MLASQHRPTFSHTRDILKTEKNCAGLWIFYPHFKTFCAHPASNLRMKQTRKIIFPLPPRSRSIITTQTLCMETRLGLVPMNSTTPNVVPSRCHGNGFHVIWNEKQKIPDTQGLKVVPPARVELATCGLGNRRSIHLSYGSKSLRSGVPALGRCTPDCHPTQHQRRP